MAVLLWDTCSGFLHHVTVEHESSLEAFQHGEEQSKAADTEMDP